MGGVVAGLAGVLLAIPALRVRGPYLAMVTIAFGFVVEQGAAEWQDLTGGWNGLSGIPGPAVFGAEVGEKGIGFLTVALTVLSIAAFSRLSDSPWGNAMRAVRDSESASISIGLDPTLIRTTAFGISAVLAGIAGGVYASISNFISPESFPFFQSILFLLVVTLGGADRLLGPLIGACVVVLLPELLATLGQYRLLFVGALMLVVLRLAPVGLVGVIAHLFPRKGHEAAPQQRTDISRFLAAGATGRGISVCNLAVSFGGVHAVKDLSFDARAGAITSIIGPNGAGKTTALNAICGFYLSPRRGHGEARRADRLGVACSSNPEGGNRAHLSDQPAVREPVGHRQRADRPAPGKARRRLVLCARRIEALLERFAALEARRHQRAGLLSGGEQQMLAIARGLMARPEVLMLDEPSLGLAPKLLEVLYDLLAELRGEGTTILLVDQMATLALSVADRAYVLQSGTIKHSGSAREVAGDPALMRAYLGDHGTAL